MYDIRIPYIYIYKNYQRIDRENGFKSFIIRYLLYALRIRFEITLVNYYVRLWRKISEKRIKS